MLVAEHQLTKNFTSTGFVINKQETDKFSLKGDFNRVAGVNLNYKSNNNKWTGVLNYGKSFNDALSKNNSFYNASIYFNKRGFNLTLQ